MARESRQNNYILYWLNRLKAGGVGAISSVFGRTGAVTAEAGDYHSSQITNASTVPGSNVTAALDDLSARMPVLPRQNPIRMSRLGQFASGLHKWNMAAHIQDNLTTYQFGGVWYQVCVFVNNARRPYIAHRALPGGSFDDDWTYFDLSTVSGNPLDSPFAYDSHNTIVVAVDSAGYIHVSGNHHAVALNYIRSTSPNSISGWTAPGMTGSNQNSVTYPQFVKMRNGTLLFFYRNGVSGNGNTFVNRYDVSTQTWSALHHPLINGTATSVNAYPWHIAVDANDVIHLAWCWRSTGGPDTNKDLFYARSADGGATWSRSTGVAQTVPITPANGEKVLDIPEGNGLVNQCGMECTSDGTPHIAFTRNVSGVAQVHHLYRAAGAWQVRQISTWQRGLSFGVSTTDGAIMRPFVFVAPGDRVYIGTAHKFTKRRGSVRCFEVTPGIPEYREFRILDLDPCSGEVTFDTQALYHRRELSFVFHPATNGAGVNHQPNVWDYQIPLVFTIDLTQIDKVQAGMVRLPCIEPLLSSALTTSGSAPSTSSTTATSTGPKVGLTPEIFEQGYMFIRHDVRGIVSGTGGDMRVYIEEDNDETGATVDYGEITVLQAHTPQINVGTPWMPVRLADSYQWGEGASADGGTLNGRWRVTSGTHTGTLNIHNIQIGVLRHEGHA